MYQENPEGNNQELHKNQPWPAQSMPMVGLTEGRIVHYVMPNGQHRPAIIVQNWNEISGTSNLIVFTDGVNDLAYTPEAEQQFRESGLFQNEVQHGHFRKTSVLFSEKPEVNTWHWIERA